MKKITLRIDDDLYNKLKVKTERKKISINSYLIDIITNDVFDCKNNVPIQIYNIREEIKKLSTYSQYQYDLLRQLFANFHFKQNENIFNDDVLRKAEGHNDYDFYN
ncbi:MAG: hypothetical protein PHF21_02790 [Bacilli bacterium]|nr:hypothetical protein [Bacilli bacterium]